MVKSNIREFSMFEITEEEQKEAAGYVCHERVIYYLFSSIYNLKYFSLFYLDRFWGWSYGEGQEPILPIHNGLEEFLEKNIYDNVKVEKEKVFESIYSYFEKGCKIIMPLWIKHFSDGTLYITPVVLEGMDEQKNVYYTKHTAVDRACARKLKKNEFESMLAVNEDGSITYSLVKDSDTVKKLSQMPLVEMFQYIFRQVYGYEYDNGSIQKEGKELEFDLSGFDTFINDIKNRPEKILTQNGIPKEQQFRLYVHINNKIRPIQNIMKTCLEDETLQEYFDKAFQEQLQEQYEIMNDAISSVQKYASIVFQKQSQKTLDLYVNSIVQLKEKMKSYQKINLELTKKLLLK